MANINKILLILLIGILSMGFVSASELPIQEFFNENVTQLKITINQNQSSSNFYLNTSETSFDLQNITFDQFTLNNIKISSFLNGINGEIEVLENSDVPEFKELNVAQNTLTSLLLDFAFDFLNLPFKTLDINNNLSIINNHLKNNPLPIKSDRHMNLIKDGNNYIFWNNKGFGDIPEDMKNEIREIIEREILSINIPDIVEQFIPLIQEQNLSFLENLDFNYTVKVELNDLYLRDGNYLIPITIERKNQSFIKNVTLILNGIQHIEERQVNDTFIPIISEIKDLIDKISGLGENNITIEFFDDFISKPINTKSVLKYINITLSNQTNASMFFKLNKSQVNNPNKVFLYVLENEWIKLNTTLINSSDFYYYKGEIPHFSLFSIIEESEELPQQEASSGGSGGGGSGGSSSRKKEPIYYPIPIKPISKTPIIEPTTPPFPIEKEEIIIPRESLEWNNNLFYLKVAFFTLLAFLTIFVIMLIYYKKRIKK